MSDAKDLATHGKRVAIERDDPLIEELADAVLVLVREMESRELHHFETEQENARLRGVMQSVYNAWHMESRQSAIDLLLPELGPEPEEAAP